MSAVVVVPNFSDFVLNSDIGANHCNDLTVELLDYSDTRTHLCTSISTCAESNPESDCAFNGGGKVRIKRECPSSSTTCRINVCSIGIIT